MFVGALIISFGIVGVIYKVWTNQIADLQQRRNKEKLRSAELAVVKSQNEKYQQRLKDLETRINTIQALQNSRTGPVELMSALGTVVNRTSDIFLYTMTPAGDHFQLKGQSSTVNSMANFIAFLKNSGTFENVNLDQFYQDDLRDRLTYKFTLNCEFKTPTGGISPSAGGAPTPPAATGSTPAIGPPNRPGATPGPGPLPPGVQPGPGPQPPPGSNTKLIR
jgi:Tfp pilus assembly protein PilN